MKAIGVSLYGVDPKYAAGALRLCRASRSHFPGWQVFIFVGKSIAPDLIAALKAEGAIVVSKLGPEDASAMFWRFEVFGIPGVDLAIIRDADSNLTKRDRRAVDEWIASGASLHIMRDHPAHNAPILGGMWGALAPAMGPMLRNLAQFSPRGFYGEDQLFLNVTVYRKFRRDRVVHDEITFRNRDSRNFPSKREGLEYVGEVVGADGSIDFERRRELREYLERDFVRFLTLLRGLLLTLVRR